MHTTRRPVPSKAALRALRQLAYVASGTACGAAAIVYEERRRRIQFFKQVAENGRVIRSFADKRRNHAIAAAVLQDYDAFDAIQHGGWSVQDPHPTHARRRRSRSRTLEDLEDGQGRWLQGSHEEYLPSQVEKGYEDLSRGGPMSLEDEAVHAPLRQPEGRTRHSTPIPRPIFDQPTTRPARGRLPSRTPDQAATVSMHDLSPAERATQVVDMWSQRFGRLPGRSIDLSESWRAVLGEAADSKQLILLDPNLLESAEELCRRSIRLRLPDLLLQFCRWAESEGMLKEVAPTIASELFIIEQPEDFGTTQDFLLGWLEQSPIRSRSKDLRLAQLQLNIMRSGTKTMAELQVFLEESMLSRRDETVDQIKSLISQLIRSHRSARATDALVAFISSTNVDRAELSRLVDSSVEDMITAGDFASCRRCISALSTKDYTASGRLLTRLWESIDQAQDLLDTFQSFGLEGVRSKATIQSLLNAILDYGPRDFALSELYGTRSGLWSGALVRKWQGQTGHVKAIKDFWKVQNLVGDRPLDPVLYTAVLRIAHDAGLSSECAAIKQHRKRVIAAASNDNAITAIMQATQQFDWAAVRSNIAQLTIEGFVTMQTQRRMQLFDPIFKAFTATDFDVNGLYLMVLELCKRIYPSTSPAHALRLLSASLIRCGNIGALVKVRSMAKDLLKRELLLSPVDVADYLRCYYYTFRPSTAVLADVMRKLSQGSWSSASRFCVPLLLVANSHEAKWNQQKRSTEHIRNILKRALSSFDDPVFRHEIMRSVGDRSVGETCQSLSAGDGLTIRKKSGPLVYEITTSRKSSIVGAAESLVKEIELERLRLDDPNRAESIDSGFATKASSSDNLTQLMMEIAQLDLSHNEEGVKLESYSTHDHFLHWKTKAMMHDSNVSGDHERTERLLNELSTSTFAPPSSSLTSLAVASAGSLSPELAEALKERIELVGADTSLARLTNLIASLSGPDIDARALQRRGVLDELKDVVSSEYQLLAECGHLVNHSLATALANVLIDARQPATAVELLRHALRLPQVRSDTAGSAPMLSLLKAYLQLGRLDGVRWVVGSMLTNDERIDKTFITALKAGRSLWQQKKNVSRAKREKILQELDFVQELCLTKKTEQIQQAADVGNELVRFLAANAKQKSKGPVLEENAEYVDALIVESVCKDIMTISQRSHHKSKMAQDIPHPEDLVLRKHFSHVETDWMQVEVAA
ncbi:hypothetical protein BDZ85DRAFT_263923 [Elsinoe ampelina]|uniref:Uncharacterized protein n=1 Tax=Elsinoe ampelina TaxID=302913 RepID=A0A6A6GA17_9PEZI|nr:hypothetical protein BDZ85DRAFT_263923 [Elsinoe ampelina]